MAALAAGSTNHVMKVLFLASSTAVCGWESSRESVGATEGIAATAAAASAAALGQPAASLPDFPAAREPTTEGTGSSSGGRHAAKEQRNASSSASGGSQFSRQRRLPWKHSGAGL